MKPKVIHYNEARADNAYKVHRALLMREAADPSLRNNPAWTIIRQDAYELFAMAFQEAN